jgi:hypothetical protein
MPRSTHFALVKTPAIDEISNGIPLLQSIGDDVRFLSRFPCEHHAAPLNICVLTMNLCEYVAGACNCHQSRYCKQLFLTLIEGAFG